MANQHGPLQIERAILARPKRADGSGQNVIQLLLLPARTSSEIPEHLSLTVFFANGIGSERCEEVSRESEDTDGREWTIVDFAPQPHQSLCLALIPSGADAEDVEHLTLHWEGGDPIKLERRASGAFSQDGVPSGGD